MHFFLVLNRLERCHAAHHGCVSYVPTLLLIDRFTDRSH